MAKSFTNLEVAGLLRRVAAAYEVLEESRFRISAYDEAAASIEHSTSEIKDIWDDGKLEEVPGVGKSIAGHLDELFKTGKVKHFEKLFKKLPPAMFVFLKIPGVGAKTAYALAKELKIFSEKNALEKLRKALKEGRLQEVKNFGEKSEENILKGIESFKNKNRETKQNRMLLPYADQLAYEVISYLKQIPEVLQADPLGSLRRMVSTVGDIDISVSTSNPQKVLNHFFKFSKIKSILGKGEAALGRVILFSGRQIDIRISKPENYGAMLQYFTGSKQHNISLREYALKKGLSLSEYGIKRTQNAKRPPALLRNAKWAGKTQNDNSKLKTFSEEKVFYEALGMEWIPPELREDAGEIDAAVRNKLPDLVKLEDIKGDLHVHSNYPIEPSHDLGESSLEEMVEIAGESGYEYLGFSEHSPSINNHSSKQIIDILKRKSEYFEQIRCSSKKTLGNRVNKLPVKIINGLEIDIKPSGELPIPEKGLEYLDYAIVSIHTSREMDKNKMTDRIIKALSYPKVKILGHPTGRLLGQSQREGCEIDWEKLFDFCLKNNKFLEISSWPERLDLPDTLVRDAVKRGVKIVIDSDSHAAEQMSLVKYGVSVARRGWAEKKDIINTLPYSKLGDILF